jgi:hypothetical protein
MSNKQTVQDWLDYANSCDLASEDGNIRLLMHEHTPAIINPIINTRMGKQRNCQYFVNMFESAIQPDGQSFDEINNVYHPNYTPKSFSFLVKNQQPCDPLTTNACDRHFEEIPSGGKSSLPQGGFFNWGLKTKPYCLQNFRTIPRFLDWLGKEAEDRARTSMIHLELFYLQVFLLTAGHKVVLEGKKQGDGSFVPYPSSDPRNPLTGYKYNWMSQFFPHVDDPNNILPLDVQTLQRLGRNWGENDNAAPIAFSGEGNGLYNLWIGDDWRTQEVDRFEDFAKLFMSIPNTQMLEGYRFEEGMKTAFGRFMLESRFNLPRFAVDEATGGIVMVQDQIGVDVEVGQEFLRNPQWMDAPFRLAVSPTRDQATILSRPPLSVHGNGAPIPVIPAFGGWKIKNEYDKDCNPHRLLPHWESWNEVGYRPKNPDGSMAIMYRARTFLNAPQNFCDLAPVFEVQSPEYANNFTNIGCENKRAMPNSVTELRVNQTDIRCSAQSCARPNIYKIKVESLAPLNPDAQTIGCPCGSTLTVLIENAAGVIREEQATLIDNSFGYPFGDYYIEFSGPLASTDCVRAVRCNDATPLVGLVTACTDISTGVVKFALDNAIVGAAVGNSVRVTYFNSAGTQVGTINGTLTALNNDLFQYTVQSATAGFGCTLTTAYAGSVDYTKTTLTKL